MSEAVRVAAWSGPRNISTAMMRAWLCRRNPLAESNRPDGLTSRKAAGLRWSITISRVFLSANSKNSLASAFGKREINR
jgi:hypothetical protein